MAKKAPKTNWTVNCYESNEDGSLTIHIENMEIKDIKASCMEIVIQPYDVSRLMYGAISALEKEDERR